MGVSIARGVVATDPSEGGQSIVNPVITGGTINNTVIGGTTPAAGTFTAVTINGDITLTPASSRITFASVAGSNANFIADVAANNSLNYQLGRAGSGTDHIFRNSSVVQFRLFGSGLGATLFEGTATPAGGTTGLGYKMGAAGIGVFFGSGAPTLSVAQGSLYLRTDGPPQYNNNGTTGYIELMGASAVNSVSPTSPNRTISVIIGGSTYYLAAKTTND